MLCEQYDDVPCFFSRSSTTFTNANYKRTKSGWEIFKMRSSHTAPCQAMTRCGVPYALVMYAVTVVLFSVLFPRSRLSPPNTAITRNCRRTLLVYSGLVNFFRPSQTWSCRYESNQCPKATGETEPRPDGRRMSTPVIFLSLPPCYTGWTNPADPPDDLDRAQFCSQIRRKDAAGVRRQTAGPCGGAPRHVRM